MDPRLLCYAQQVRWYLVGSAALIAFGAAGQVALAYAVARVLSSLVTDPTARSVGAQAPSLAIGVAAVLTLIVVAYARRRYADHGAHVVIGQLRATALDALKPGVASRGATAARPNRDAAETSLTVGLDSLAPYLTEFLPAAIAAMVVTPAMIVVIACADWPSAVIALVTVPLIPIFMVLIGTMTKDRTAQRLSAMSALSAQLTDLIAALPTLRALGRASEPAAQVAGLGERYRTATMRTLRVAFLSALVLELLATLCVALIAVTIGFRLVYADMTLFAGVFALILAPEVYAPLRAVGAKFHASQDGLTAARQVFAIIESPTTSAAAVPAGSLRCEGVSVAGRDGWAPYQATFVAAPGRFTVLTGPNGAGKSTALRVLLGLCTPAHGVVATPPDLWSRVAWLPQRPLFVPGTLAENLCLFGPITAAARNSAAVAVGFDEVLAELPDGWETVIGADGAGLSLGQRQRLALVRVLARDTDILLLDEPTAHLDAAARDRVVAALRERAADGDIVLVVSHSAAVQCAADDTVPLSAARRNPVPLAARRNPVPLSAARRDPVPLAAGRVEVPLSVAEDPGTTGVPVIPGYLMAVTPGAEGGPR